MSSENDFSSLIPKVAKFLATGTDSGNIILLLKNSGFDVDFDSISSSGKSKQDFLHNLFIDQSKAGNLRPFYKLSDLILVKEYFRPGEYEYAYNEEGANKLSEEIKRCLKIEDKPPSPVTVREVSYILLNLHKGLDAVSKKLFLDGHYEQAANEACKFFENYLQDRIRDKSKSGVRLLAEAFGGDNPKISLYEKPMNDDRKNEHEGYHDLARGEIRFVRNRLSHKDSGSILKTRSSCLKVLSLVSFLLETLDRMHIQPNRADEISLEDIPF